jgi:membrane-bound lytic murein transglycosylase D
MRDQLNASVCLMATCLSLILFPASAFGNDIALPPGLALKLAPLEAAAEMTSDVPVDETPLSNEEINDIWARIRRGFAIPDLQNPLVAGQMNWYVNRPDYIQRTTIRASRYLYHVLEELEKRNMPTELALLPFIESAFNPEAYSSAKAAGMWQFIPSTGRDYNLAQNLFRDDRRNVIASTDAALTYLQKLYGIFGDWQLALAAYNWGEGSVGRAIRKNQAMHLPIDFNSLSRHMPNETRNYVPKLQAVKNIIADPAQYHLALPKVNNQPYFTAVNKTGDIDVKVAAQLAEMPLDEFKALNPQFNRPVITGNDQTKILLPQENADKFKINLAGWGRSLSSWTTHTITTAREKIEALAAKFSTTPDVLREANHIPPKMRLRAGSTILVPKSEESHNVADIAPALVDSATLSMEPDVADFRRVSYRVGKRDSIASVAQRYKVSVAQLREWNGLRQDKLSAGQSLQIQVPNRLARARAGRSSMVAHHHVHGKPVVVARHGKRRHLG